jgi:hypothetical protein
MCDVPLRVLRAECVPFLQDPCPALSTDSNTHASVTSHCSVRVTSPVPYGEGLSVADTNFDLRDSWKCPHTIQELNTFVQPQVWGISMPNLTKGMRTFAGYDDSTTNMLSVTCAEAIRARESDTTTAFTHGNAPSFWMKTSSGKN